MTRYEIKYKCGKTGKSANTDKPELEVMVQLGLSHLFNDGCRICGKGLGL